MKLKRFLWFLLYLIIVLLPSAFYVLASINSHLLLILSGVFGITSFTLLSFQFILTSRIKIIEKYYSLDKIYRFHMIIAIVALIFAFIHKTLKEMYFSESFQTELGDITFNIFIAVSVFSILMMINKLFIKINLVDIVRKFLNKTFKIKYQYKVLIHNVTLIGLIILFVHILLAYSVESNLLLKIILIVYFVVPFALYFHHKIINVYFNKNKRYTVTEIINESDNIVTIKMKPNNNKLFHYLPGQFIYVTISNPEIPGDEHPFTISSSPSERNYISVTAKQLGDFTGRLNKVKIGDKAYIDGPFGTFSYLKDNNKKICFIAGGIGITPFLGMLRYMNAVDRNMDVVLLWGARDLSEVIVKHELEDYVSKFKNFKFVPILSNDKTFTGEKGFINTEIIKKHLDHYLEYDFYICGPPIMLDLQLKNLISLGVPKKNIHYERFTI